MSDFTVFENKKVPYLKYDPKISDGGAQGGIHLYIPTEVGYIDHTYGHTVKEDINADVWRLSVAYMCDDNLENPVALTPTHAEWDMAVMIEGRPDFIGGYAHGDERMTDIEFFVDGARVDVTKLTTATEFKRIDIVENSVAYDPLDGKTAVFNHHKEYTVTCEGITLDQKLKWLGDYTIGRSYLAMMPPEKKYTDAFYTDITEPADIVLGDQDSRPHVEGATSITVYGKESGFSFTMSVKEYNTFNPPYTFITDNGGGAYNKMYFLYAKSGTVSKGDEWDNFTHYRIERRAVTATKS